MEKSSSTYYPGNGSKVYYGLYSPPLRRFLLIDHHNIFALFKTAQVLSSKINTVLFILSKEENYPQMTNENCLRFTFQHNKFQHESNGQGLKQSPTATFLRADRSVKIIKANLPAEFNYEDRKRKILETQNYAQYVNNCMHAIMLTEIIYQQIHIEQEQDEYNSFLFNKPLEPTLTTNVMNILTYAENIEAAQSQINTFWLKIITENLNKRVYYPEKWKRELQKHCSEFYKILGADTPDNIQTAIDNVKI